MKKVENKAALKKSIIYLLSKKKAVDITVTDLVRESKVPRASFYRLYKNVDEVINDVVKDITDNFDNNVSPAVRARDERKIKKIFTDFFIFVKQPRNPFTNMLPENYSMIISKIGQHNPGQLIVGSNKIMNKYVPKLFLLNVSSIAKMWCKSGYVESIEEMVEFTYNTLCKTLIYIT